MDQFDRIYQLDRIFQHYRHPVSMDRLTEELECSKSSVKRTIEAMRLYYNAPIQYSRSPKGYCYLKDTSQTFELPGMWFSAGEIHALFVIDHFLKAIDPGLLKDALLPFEQRIEHLMSRAGVHPDDTIDRIKIIAVTHRQSEPTAFRLVADALMRARQLELKYHARGSDRTSERRVSPQRLIHYRDNWYLDAWCHHKDALRTFALDRIRQVHLIDQPAYQHDVDKLESHFASAFGIFAGEATHTATLKFTAKQARWVADEQWHPEQIGQSLEDGSYKLQLPYRNPQELTMEILKYGPEVEVIDPPELRKSVQQQLKLALKQYEN